MLCCTEPRWGETPVVNPPTVAQLSPEPVRRQWLERQAHTTNLMQRMQALRRAQSEAVQQLDATQSAKQRAQKWVADQEVRIQQFERDIQQLLQKILAMRETHAELLQEMATDFTLSFSEVTLDVAAAGDQVPARRQGVEATPGMQLTQAETSTHVKMPRTPVRNRRNVLGLLIHSQLCTIQCKHQRMFPPQTPMHQKGP